MENDLEEAFDRWFTDFLSIVIDVNAMAILEGLEGDLDE